MKRVLVTGGNGDIAIAVGRILADCFPEFLVHGADAKGKWPGSFIFKRMHSLPYADHPDYILELGQIASDYDLVIPTNEPELFRLARDCAAAEGKSILMARADIVTRFVDKLDTAIWLEAIGLAPPKTQLLRDAQYCDLPVIVKPRRGNGNRGYQVIRTNAELDVAKAGESLDLVAQEFVGDADHEYTCAIFAGAGEVRTLTLRRWLAGGRTVRAEVADIPDITHLLQRIASTSGLVGCINVQLRMGSDGPKVFEINPRLSSTVRMRHLVGFCDLKWWIESLSGKVSEFVLPVPARRLFAMYDDVVVPE